MSNDVSCAMNRASEKSFGARRLAVVAFVTVLVLLVLLPGPAGAADFVAGPAVRVVPNNKIEIRWIAPFVGHGVVRIFDNPEGSGTPIDALSTEFNGNDQTVDRVIGGVITTDTTYYFKVTHSDPTGIREDLTNEPPLPAFFTGAQPPGLEPAQPKLIVPNPEDSGFTRFINSVAIDGDTVVVGANPRFSEGAVYVFVKPEGGWVPTTTFAARLTASSGSLFGRSVVIDGDTVVVDGVYVFVKPANGWAGNLVETARLAPSTPAIGFGSSAAIAGDAIVVGAEHNDNFKGSAYVFTKPAGGWAGIVTETARLTASDGKPFHCDSISCHEGDHFGHSVGISGDTVVVGAPSNDSTQAFGLEGAAYVHVKPASGWAGILNESAKLAPSNGLSHDQFGSAVAIRGDTLVVGAPRSGWLTGGYVFVRPAEGWTGNRTESARLKASDGAFFDDFGTSVAISGDRILIGAPINDGAGAAYLFNRPAAGWTGELNEAVKLTASDGKTFDFLGVSVAISDETLVAGAEEWDDFQVSAYVFPAAAPTDTTAPAITPVISGTLGNNGWYVDDASISWDVQDAESAITSTSGCDASVVNQETTGVSFTCTATSSGGTASESVNIKLDKTAPAVVCVAPDGLWHNADIALGCTADGSISGLANPADAAFNLTTSIPVGAEDANAATNSRTVDDNAGNSTLMGPITGNKVDKKAPAITINSPAATIYLLNQSVASDYLCADGGSGLASCTGPVASGVNISTSAPGAHSFTVHASDKVGNAGSATANYQVQYLPGGGLCNGAPSHQILDPIRADGTSVFRQKSTVPARFRVCDANGVSIGTPGVVSSFNLIQVISGTNSSDANETVSSTTPDTAFRWDSVEQAWVFNISNHNLAANATYVFRISLNDGTHIDFQYGLK